MGQEWPERGWRVLNASFRVCTRTLCGTALSFSSGAAPWSELRVHTWRLGWSRAGEPASRGTKSEVAELRHAGGLNLVSEVLVEERGGTSGDAKPLRLRWWWVLLWAPTEWQHPEEGCTPTRVEGREPVRPAGRNEEAGGEEGDDCTKGSRNGRQGGAGRSLEVRWRGMKADAGRGKTGGETAG